MTLEDARVLDAADPLRDRRALFALPDGVIYLDGNSLGAMPAATPARVAETVVAEWGRDLITSWNAHGWIDAPRRLGAAIARLVGAREDEVIVADSTSANLFKLLAAACAARPGRTTILSEPGNFPTDLYVADGVARMLPGRRVRTAAVDDIASAIDADTAVVMLTHVHYKTGRRLDMAAITAAAHARGALMLWDLSHSVGAVELDLAGCDVDLAVGCGYKYLNGGPGAPAFLHVARRLHGELRSPLSGWMGHGEPFAFRDDYAPAEGMARFLCGTPPILAMAALERGIATFDGVTMRQVAAKSRGLIDLFVAEVERRGLDTELTLLSPRDAGSRGSHVSYAHRDAHAVCQALIARGVIGDFRAPDAVRFGFTPLYLGYANVWRAVEILADVLATGAWRDERYRVRSAVT
ncbi:kynureninase [Sphingomonas corticis]|jgi:kynureninase|uniref:Kynureninase n=1 Tax=Sphingomonas corticis TaxID=2722791 RepID=A0ABX1CNM0_9SPHN|nr:kynureninase [Sphingomonas corticis]NJR79504.1 kynureninase [Sphingomonas corticis]